MIIRPASSTDFDHLETFVWQSIFPAFDVDGLTDEQRAENDAMVESARDQVITALHTDNFTVLVAIDPKLRRLAGYVVADSSPRSYAELRTIVVKKAYWGKGVAPKLLEGALDAVGRHRPVSLAVRYFNDRAKAFFAKHDFSDTGELAGEFAIPRTLMIREGEEVATAGAEGDRSNAPIPEPEPAMDGRRENVPSLFDGSTPDDFPTEADEPVFESLPDYNLAADAPPDYEPPADYTLTTDDSAAYPTGDNALTAEEGDGPLFGETTLDADTQNELADFIARAKASKAKPKRQTTQRSKKRTAPKSPVEEATDVDTSSVTSQSFQFDFEPVDEPGQAERESTENTPADISPLPAPSPPEEATAEPVRPAIANSDPAKNTEAPMGKICPTCATHLPPEAKFCHNCGTPQTGMPRSEAASAPIDAPTEADVADGDPEPSTNEVLWTVDDDGGTTVTDPLAVELEVDGENEHAAYESAPVGRENEVAVEDDRRRNHGTGAESVTTRDLSQDFRDRLYERVQRYFGAGSIGSYTTVLENDYDFQRVRDGSLSILANWLNDNPDNPDRAHRILNIQEDLVEYFLVKAADEVHRGAFPKRILRHQSVDWQTVDIFRLVMDYLDFEGETEIVYTDFMTMPPRALKNATQSFLRAARDERVLFVCDQSLISKAKNGFAMTDAGIYWKNVFQPPGQSLYKLMPPPKLEDGHLTVDGQFFDAGATLNIKVALLLDKLRRISPPS